MGLEKLTYTPTGATANDHPITMVLMVDDEMLQKYRNGDKTISLAQVVHSFEVSKYHTPGIEGKLVKPSNTEKLNVFGTKNDTEIVEFMIQHGTVRATKHGKAKKPMEPVCEAEKLMHADRRAY
jgi:ribosome maturation protein Sdo1